MTFFYFSDDIPKNAETPKRLSSSKILKIFIPTVSNVMQTVPLPPWTIIVEFMVSIDFKNPVAIRTLCLSIVSMLSLSGGSKMHTTMLTLLPIIWPFWRQLSNLDSRHLRKFGKWHRLCFQSITKIAGQLIAVEIIYKERGRPNFTWNNFNLTYITCHILCVT